MPANKPFLGNGPRQESKPRLNQKWKLYGTVCPPFSFVFPRLALHGSFLSTLNSSSLLPPLRGLFLNFSWHQRLRGISTHTHTRTHLHAALSIPQSVRHMALERKRTSSSAGTTYRVFLSFRGPDTRQGFADVLYHALTDAGIHVFRDDEEIRKGEDIGDEIMGAIGESRIFVPIFSRGYASSKWCLIELSKIFESMEASPDSGKKILPVFYDVSVEDVKLKTELYAEALFKHREKFTPDTVQQWKQALRKAGKIKGYEVKDTGHGEFIKMLVREISMKLKVKHKYVTEYLVQRNDQVEALMELLDIKASGVRSVGIHGMGGIGKTTLASIVFNKICYRYECCCYLTDVRESSQQYKGIENLQKQLLRDLGLRSEGVVDVSDGIEQLKQNFLHKKVLIVLDDVDHKKQFQNLAGDASWFGSGSGIIITTRNQEVLGKVVRTFEVVEMETEELLSFSACMPLNRSPLLLITLVSQKRLLTVPGDFLWLWRS